MAATVAEAEALVGDAVDPDAKTRAQQKHIDEANEQVPPVKQVRVLRTLRLKLHTYGLTLLLHCADAHNGSDGGGGRSARWPSSR